MTRIPSRAVIALFSSIGLTVGLATAVEFGQVEIVGGEEVRLDDNDLRNITMEVLKTHPHLSGSPGIKYADVSRDILIEENATSWRDWAFVVFYPHSESRGVKNAYQAHCERPVPKGAWTCSDVQIRRYVTLDSQDFEVRVKGDLSLDDILAVIEVTKEHARTCAQDGSQIPDIVMMVSPMGVSAGDGYHVSWHNKERTWSTSVEARLRNGGSPSNPYDWQAQCRAPQP